MCLQQQLKYINSTNNPLEIMHFYVQTSSGFVHISSWMYLASYKCDNCSYIESPEDNNHTDESESVPEEERKMLCLADIWLGSVKTT